MYMCLCNIKWAKNINNNSQKKNLIRKLIFNFTVNECKFKILPGFASKTEEKILSVIKGAYYHKL